MADTATKGLTEETVMTASMGFPLQEGAASDPTTYADFSLMGGLVHSDETADSNITGAVGTLHYVEMNSGTPWTADRNFTLPTTARVGERVAIIIKDGDGTHECLVKAGNDTGEINGTDENWNTNTFARLAGAGQAMVFRTVDATGPKWVTEYDSRITERGEIRLQSEPITIDSASSYSVKGPFEIMIDGVLYHSTGDIQNTSVSVSADTIYYIYLASDGAGGLTMTQTTTAPQWDDVRRYFRSGTDVTTRCVGFLTTVDGGADLDTGPTYKLLSKRKISKALPHEAIVTLSADTSGSWASTSIATLVPAAMLTDLKIGFSVYDNTTASTSAGIGFNTESTSLGWFGSQFYGLAYSPVTTAGPVTTADLTVIDGATTLYYKTSGANVRSSIVFKECKYIL